jgi:hypothetical protein
VDSHSGKVQLVIRYAPFHEGSDTAVQILEAARLQGLFWPVMEATLKAQPVWAAHDKPRPELTDQTFRDQSLRDSIPADICLTKMGKPL